MLEPNETALLPEGLHDTLVGDASRERKVVEKLLNSFSSHGYDLVLPPLVEFEESLLLGPGKAHSRNMFRLLDPASQRMMGVRTDMTGQVARISHSRLGNAPRPLRLSYAGDVLRIKGTQLRPERQFKQAGVELIGSNSTEAYTEIILLGYEALKNVGAKNLSVDLALPQLVPAICKGLKIDDELSALLRRALDGKNIAELSNIKGDIGNISRSLLEAAGPAPKCLDIINGLKLPEAAAEMCAELSKLVARLAEIAPDLMVTVDPGEYTGFEYQTGISFSLFASGVRGELGRGGRYLVNGEHGEGEPATGFSLYLDSLMRALDGYEPQKKVFVPYGIGREDLSNLQSQGYNTISGLEEYTDIAAEAKRMECDYYWSDGQINEITGGL
ncbi:MAG: ATP phosphoribosyltransferase regulatory subunit [Kordiimonadaceae bacterium]|jgi:ATP phosphoribosyltransferase regulatory subunit|nr:ATP phosphoribosyltransferase regulatory subunit [Kordiimonadaceae bacterium]